MKIAADETANKREQLIAELLGLRTMLTAAQAQVRERNKNKIDVGLFYTFSTLFLKKKKKKKSQNARLQNDVDRLSAQCKEYSSEIAKAKVKMRAQKLILSSVIKIDHFKTFPKRTAVAQRGKSDSVVAGLRKKLADTDLELQSKQRQFREVGDVMWCDVMWFWF